MSTKGFYKKEDTGLIIYAPNFVHLPTGVSLYTTEELEKQEDPEYKMESIDGWNWFNSEEEAYKYYEITTTDSNDIYIITRMQAKVALLRIGLLEQVEQKVAASSPEVQIMWNDALHFRRDSPLLNSLATELGLSGPDLDNLFISAKTIEP